MTTTTRWRRNVALFLTGQTVSLFGSMIAQYAVMWWVTLQTRSGLAVALYAVAAFLPQGVVSIFGGVLADRMNRRVLVMIADGAIALATLVLGLLMANGVTDLWIVLLAVAVRSLGAGVQTPAVQAMIPQIVPGEQLMRVNGIFQTIHSAMALLAPAVAAAIFASFGLVSVFFLDVVTAVIGIGLLALVAVPSLERVAEARVSYRQDLVDGLRYVRSHPIVRWLLIVYAVIFLLTVAPSFVTPLMVARSFGTEEWMLAALEIAFSLGMLLGGVLMSTVLANRSRIGLILVAVHGFGLATVALGLSGNLWVFYGFMFVFGLLVPPFSTPFMTLIQETVEPAMHGRVFSYVGIVMALATPVGMAVFGPLADVVSVQILLIAAGLAAIAVIAIASRLPSGRATIAAARVTRASDAEAAPADA
ncbi:enterobactin exporter EntS [Nonomuraea coxensis DSM 45129]|uniref:Enterobactin exporter EntS n=1 Tax=Nonomuraea coxensis DSM 45129 TaxID=1122611 RepID=A0ABX8U561_9ACTN|nr:MFS transporter [Nonomuraea coxensis]QYC42031.1 enterobactin exporter EntS [Nonomuraea coxensis DSM 45129]